MKNKIEPVKTGAKYTPWKVDLPASFTGTRRLRKYFATREGAVAWVARLRLVGLEGMENEKWSKNGKWEMKNGVAEGVGLTVTELIALYLDRQRNRVGRATMRQLRYVTRSLDGALGARLLAAVSHQELEAWLLSVPSGTTRWNHYRVARRLWQYAIDWLEVVERNPLKKIEVAAERYGRGLGNEKWKMENAKGAEEEWRSVAVLEPGEMGAALDAAENFSEPGRSRLLAWLALGGFAGLRTEEILHARWADVDLGAGEIFVRQPKRVRGWHPRYVKILPACSRVLGACVRPTDKTAGVVSVRSRDAQGRIVWDSPLVLPGGQRSLYLLRRELMDALGWARWPQNCLRHSFGTYHLAMFRDLAALAAEMGHESEGVTRRHYAMPAKRADAEAWWSLGKC